MLILLSITSYRFFTKQNWAFSCSKPSDNFSQQMIRLATLMQNFYESTPRSKNDISSKPSKYWEKGFKDSKNNLKNALEEIRLNINKCKEINKVPSYLTNLNKTVKSLSHIGSKKHQFGFNVEDLKYIKDTQKLTSIPRILKNQKFLNALSPPLNLDQAKHYLEITNKKLSQKDRLIYFSYISRHLGTPDNEDAFGRLLIIVPGEIEKWVQFGIHRNNLEVKNVSVISVNKETHDTYYSDNYRIRNEKNLITFKHRYFYNLEKKYDTQIDRCVTCHTTGVIPIIPEKNSVSKKEIPQLIKANNRFLSYMPPKFGGYISELRSGPVLGKIKETNQRMTLLRRCAPKVSLDIKKKIASSMNCATCHNNKALGSFYFPFKKIMLHEAIINGNMPPAKSYLSRDTVQDTSSLSKFERKTIYECLIEEYFGNVRNKSTIDSELYKWLINDQEFGVRGSSSVQP